MPYETYIKESILEPAGIYDMHLGHNLKAEKLEREVDYISQVMAPSCYGDGSLVLNQYGGFNLEAMNAHGGWVSSAPDLARLFAILRNGGILEEQTKAKMLAHGQVYPYYALGWQVNEKGNYWHTGSMDGTSAFAANTVDGYTWVFLFNSRSDNSPAFWKALDKLPRAAMKTVGFFPRLDLFAPLFNSSLITARVVSPGKLHLQWLSGDGDQRIVVASTEPLVSFPLDGIHYQADAEFGVGDRVSENAFVVYNGNGDRTMVSGLDPKRTYYFTIIEYRQNNKTGNKEVYKLGGRETVAVKTATGIEI
jgi:CubicO group peptidase (beta-lactamase class C family)